MECRKAAAFGEPFNPEQVGVAGQFPCGGFLSIVRSKHWRSGCSWLRTGLYVIFCALFWLMASGSARSDDLSLLATLKQGNHFAIMRHALAPGTGDPGSFDVRDCGTQRNLSEVGRQQSRAIGDRFRAAGITSAEIYSSQWCRCLETARGLDLGPVTELALINSFFRNFEREESQTNGLKHWLKRWLKERRPGKSTILVTHQVNIRALTGLGTRSGEVVILRLDADGSTHVVGQVKTPYQ